ncbi:aldehyde dehydrogenase family protein [Pseudomonas coronafaciens]|uniref:aldehyde dehydrogenase family protein n=1 Tax=Pseudomonas coronafaciens TaxID=53409 RepID=UPI000F010568|nr:aldehyde dehydrogenase family protein [Pseudomonas coronafaciens]
MWWKHIAQKIQERTADDNSIVAMGAGFGPSGFPHIGTLCEVLRVSIVKTAFERLSGKETRLFIISDDMDALRKIPATFPKTVSLENYLGVPLCDIADPFQQASSLSAGINKRLDSALAPYTLDYQLIENSSLYRSGYYNTTIRKFLLQMDTLNQVIASRLGVNRRKSYSLFMPISRHSGRVIEHLVIQSVDLSRGEIVYTIPPDLLINRPGEEYSITSQEYYADEPIGENITVSVLDGHCKLQWKADWAMRLIHRNTAFEMHGEDLTDSANTVRDICKVLGVQPPLLMRYGLFTDMTGHKISKSKGNGFSLNQVSRYMPEEALQHFMFNNPYRTTRFHPEVSVKAYDSYRADHARLDKDQPDNPINYFHRVPAHAKRLTTYRTMMNIFTACHPEDLDTAYHYLLKHEKTRHDIINDDTFATVIEKAFAYYKDVIAPAYRPRLLDTQSAALLHSFSAQLKRLDVKNKFITCLLLNPIVDSVGFRCQRDAYKTIYACLFGDEHGPRLAEYINFLGVQAFCEKLDSRIQQAAHDREYDPMKEDTHASQEALQMSDAANHTAKSETLNTSDQAPEAIDFDEIKARAEAYALHLRSHSESIAESLSGFECYNVAVDEIERCIEFLENIELNRSFFERRVNCVTSYLPLNQPIYATTCFGIIPSLLARSAWLRPPTAMHPHYKKLLNPLKLDHFFPNLHVSFADKDTFVSQTAAISDAVIFTGTPENAAKVRKSYLKRTLFILNGAGHNPLVVAADACITTAVESALRVVLYNQGQDCAGPNSIMVHVEAYPEFIRQLRKELTRCEGLVGDYKCKKNIVGPNSDPDHTLKVMKMFRDCREHCTYGGEINPVSGLIRPTIFERPLSLGGNYKEFFAPVFFVQLYSDDAELASYFEHPLYSPNSMYISLFGSSDYISGLIEQVKHDPCTVLSNTDLHIVEKGYAPYGGQGVAASCLYVNGVRIAKPTLPQRDIHEHLVAHPHH